MIGPHFVLRRQGNSPRAVPSTLASESGKPASPIPQKVKRQPDSQATGLSPSLEGTEKNQSLLLKPGAQAYAIGTGWESCPGQEESSEQGGLRLDSYVSDPSGLE